MISQTKKLPLLLAVLLMSNVQAEVLIDPTQPIGFSHSTVQLIEEKAAMPKLNSILIGKSRRLAIIDGKPYHKGDSLIVDAQNYEVANILKKSVVLTEAGIEMDSSQSAYALNRSKKNSGLSPKRSIRNVAGRLELKLNSQGVEEN